MFNDVLYASGTLYNVIHILDMSNPILIVHDNKWHKKDNLNHLIPYHALKCIRLFDPLTCDVPEKFNFFLVSS